MSPTGPGRPWPAPETSTATAKADVLVGSFLADPSTRSNAGSAYLVYGKPDSTAVDLRNLGSAGYEIAGAVAADEAGRGVAGIGDVNGDGVPDALVGAPGVSVAGRSKAGAAYVSSASGPPRSG